MRPLLRNRFRKLVGVLILLVMGVAVFQYLRQTSGNEYVVDAIFSGMKFLLVLALVLWLVWLYDRRLKKRAE